MQVYTIIVVSFSLDIADINKGSFSPMYMYFNLKLIIFRKHGSNRLYLSNVSSICLILQITICYKNQYLSNISKKEFRYFNFVIAHFICAYFFFTEVRSRLIGVRQRPEFGFCEKSKFILWYMRNDGVEEQSDECQ